MSAPLYYLKIYLLIISQYLKARMQYRADFIISSVGITFSSLVGLTVFSIIFDSIPTLAGWNFEELLFIYSFYLLAIAPLQIFFDHIWALRFHVIEGTFIKYYFKPIDMMFYYMSEMIDIKGFIQLFIGIFLLIYASRLLEIEWNLLQIFVFFVLLGSASLIIISLLIMAASSAFWFLHSYPLLAFTARLREFAPYPVTIFDTFFRLIFTYIIPIGFVAYYPSQIFLRPNNVPLITYFSPLVGIAFFILAYKIWNKGVEHYSGTGS